MVLIIDAELFQNNYIFTDYCFKLLCVILYFELYLTIMCFVEVNTVIQYQYVFNQVRSLIKYKY